MTSDERKRIDDLRRAYIAGCLSGTYAACGSLSVQAAARYPYPKVTRTRMVSGRTV